MHQMFQRLGITPDDFYKKPFKIRQFMEASMIVQLEAEAERGKE